MEEYNPMENSGNGIPKGAHIAAEVVLVGAMAFYFNNQIKSLKQEIAELKEKIETDTATYTKHFNTLYQMNDGLKTRLLQSQMFPRTQQSAQPRQVPLGMRNRKQKVRFVPTEEQMDQPDPFSGLETFQGQQAPVDLDNEIGPELAELEDEEVEEQQSPPPPTSSKKKQNN